MAVEHFGHTLGVGKNLTLGIADGWKKRIGTRDKLLESYQNVLLGALVNNVGSIDFWQS